MTAKLQILCRDWYLSNKTTKNTSLPDLDVLTTSFNQAFKYITLTAVCACRLLHFLKEPVNRFSDNRRYQSVTLQF